MSSLSAKVRAEISEADRRERLKAIGDERQLHSLLRSVLLGLGYKHVDISHGANEHGKDLVAVHKTITGGEEYHAVVVKLGNLGGSAKLSGTVEEVKRQVSMAFSVRYQSLSSNSKVHISKVLVVCNGRFSAQAREQIIDQELTFRNVEFWDVGDLDEHVTTHHPAFFLGESSAMIEYLGRLDDFCEDIGDYLQRYGLRSGKHLRDIYVEPRILLVPGVKERAMKGIRLPKRSHRNIAPRAPDVEVFDTKLLMEPPSHLFLIGEPGSGKSRALRRAVSRLITARLSGQDAAVPLWCNAPTLARHLACGSATAAIHLSQPIKSPLEEGDITSILAEKASILFVDALDEVGSAEGRGSVLAALQEIAKRYPRCKIVCGTRPIKYWKVEEIPGFRESWLLPMTSYAMSELLTKILGQESSAKAILRSLSETGLGKSLPQTPLVVTILAILDQQAAFGEVPANLADLYRMFVEVYLGKWSVDPGANAPYSYAVLHAILERFAMRVHEERMDLVPYDTLVEVASVYMKERRIAGDAAEVAEHLLTKSGIIKLSGVARFPPSLVDKTSHVPAQASASRSVSFAHRSFQEYFVASYWDSARKNERKLFENLLDPWWSTVCFFYAGLRKDVPELVDYVVNELPPATAAQSLYKSVQLGFLLQAGHQTPVDAKTRACLHGGGLLREFYDYWASVQEKGGTPIVLSRFELALSVAFFFSLAYGSGYLQESVGDAFAETLSRYTAEGVSSDERLQLGLVSFALALALAERGSFDPLSKFCDVVSNEDLALLQAASFLLDAESSRQLAPLQEVDTQLEAARDEAWRRNIGVLKRKASKWKKEIAGDITFPAKPIGKSLKSHKE